MHIEKNKSQYKIVSNCPLCGFSNISFKYKLKQYTLMECKECELIFLGNVPSKQFYKKYYSNKIISPNIYELVIRKDAIETVRLLTKYIDRKLPVRVLDIGCGNGYLLNELAIRTNWILEGIDLSKSCVNTAREKFGLNVELADVFNYRTKNKYDLIVLNQVIEHFYNINGLINKCYNLLLKNKYLYISTPNISSLASRIFNKEYDYIIPPEHILYFNKISLFKLLNINNFTIQTIKTWGYEEELVGILKKIIKNNHNRNKSVNKIIVKQKSENNINFKHILIDKYIMSKLKWIFNFYSMGNIIDLIATKNI